MAIQTHGFGVDVMPRYTAPDPSLLAMNPDAVTRGVLSAFQIANDKEKLDAFRHQQDEINALRQDRMASARARFAGDVTQQGIREKTAPGVIGATNAQNDYIKNIKPLEGDFQSLKLHGDIDNQPTLNDIARLKSTFEKSQVPILQQVAAEQNQTALDTSFNRGETARNQAALDARNSGMWEQQADNFQAKLQVDAANLEKERQAIDLATQNLGLNASQDQRLKAAKINLLEHQAQYKQNRGLYYAYRASGQGRSMDQFKMDMQHESATRDNLRKAAGQQVDTDGNGKPVTLGMYNAMSRDPNGGIKDKYKPGGSKYNKFAESLLPEMHDHMTMLEQMRKDRQPKPDLSPGDVPKTVSLPTAGVQPQAPAGNEDIYNTPATGFDRSSLSPDQQEAYDWATSPDNADNPKAKIILDSLGQTGTE